MNRRLLLGSAGILAGGAILALLVLGQDPGLSGVESAKVIDPEPSEGKRLDLNGLRTEVGEPAAEQREAKSRPPKDEKLQAPPQPPTGSNRALVELQVLGEGDLPRSAASVEFRDERGWQTGFVSDLQGRVTVEAVGDNLVFYAESGNESTGEVSVRGGWDPDTSPLVLRLRPKLRLSGRVLLDEGMEPTNTKVAIQVSSALGAPTPRVQPEVPVGSDGSFEVMMDGVEATARVFGLNGTRISNKVRVELPRHSEEILLDLRVRGLGVTGRVHNAAGQPVEGAAVSLHQGGSPHRRSVETDEFGGFQIVVPAPGAYTIQASHPDYCSSAVVEMRVPYSEALNLTLDSMASIEGVVLGSDGGPLGLVDVAAIQVSRNVFMGGLCESLQSRTDEEGRFRFNPVKAGAEYYLLCIPDMDRRNDVYRLSDVYGGDAEIAFLIDPASNSSIELEIIGEGSPRPASFSVQIWIRAEPGQEWEGPRLASCGERGTTLIDGFNPTFDVAVAVVANGDHEAIGVSTPHTLFPGVNRIEVVTTTLGGMTVQIPEGTTGSLRLAPTDGHPFKHVKDRELGGDRTEIQIERLVAGSYSLEISVQGEWTPPSKAVLVYPGSITDVQWP